eukprot:3413249-Prymnesium_polylepis.1
MVGRSGSEERHQRRFSRLIACACVARCVVSDIAEKRSVGRSMGDPAAFGPKGLSASLFALVLPLRRAFRRLPYGDVALHHWRHLPKALLRRATHACP